MSLVTEQKYLRTLNKTKRLSNLLFNSTLPLWIVATQYSVLTLIHVCSYSHTRAPFQTANMTLRQNYALYPTAVRKWPAGAEFSPSHYSSSLHLTYVELCLWCAFLCPCPWQPAMWKGSGETHKLMEHGAASDSLCTDGEGEGHGDWARPSVLLFAKKCRGKALHINTHASIDSTE